MNSHAVFFQLTDDIDDLAVAEVGAVFFERQTQHIHHAAIQIATRLDERFHSLLGDVGTHAVVDAPPREDDLGVMTKFFRLIGKIVRVNADAMATDQARSEFQEIPFGAGSFQNFCGIQPHAIENNRQLIHERDIQIAL